MKITDNFDHLKEVIEGDDGIKHHKERLRNLEDILHGASRFRFKVSYTVISHVSDCATSHGRKDKSRD